MTNLNFVNFGRTMKFEYDFFWKVIIEFVTLPSKAVWTMSEKLICGKVWLFIGDKDNIKCNFFGHRAV